VSLHVSAPHNKLLLINAFLCHLLYTIKCALSSSDPSARLTKLLYLSAISYSSHTIPMHSLWSYYHNSTY
jgi:hypothetical protein